MSKFSLVFLVFFVFFITRLVFVDAVYGVYFYEVLYFLNPSSRWWGREIPNISYSFIVVFLMLSCLFLNQRHRKNNNFIELKESKLLLAIFFSFLMATFVAANKEVHVKFLIEYVKLMVTMYAVYKLIDTSHKLNMAVFFYLVGAAYIGFEATNVGRNSGIRVEGIGMVDSPDANTTAAALVPAVPFLIYYFWLSPLKFKIIFIVLGAFVVNGLILINSRGAFLGGFVGVAYLMCVFWFTRFRFPKQRFYLVVIMVVGFLSFMQLTDSSFWNRMGTIDESSSADSEGSGGRRINFWLATFDLMNDFPLGVGIYGYQTLSPIYLKEESYFSDVKAVDGVKLRAVHSIWFQGLSEIGWHGMMFFLLLLISIKKKLALIRRLCIESGRLKSFYFSYTLEASMLSFLVAGSFIDVFRAQVLYWLLIYCLCFICISKRRFISESNKI